MKRYAHSKQIKLSLLKGPIIGVLRWLSEVSSSNANGAYASSETFMMREHYVSSYTMIARVFERCCIMIIRTSERVEHSFMQTFVAIHVASAELVNLK